MALVRFKPATTNGYFPASQTASENGFSNYKPAVNIVSTKDGFRIELAAPGLQKEDFQVKVEKDILTIKVEKEQPAPNKGVQYQRREFIPAAFERVFRLPETTDSSKIDARYTNGILVLDLVNKPETQPVRKTIAVG